MWSSSSYSYKLLGLNFMRWSPCWDLHGFSVYSSEYLLGSLAPVAGRRDFGLHCLLRWANGFVGVLVVPDGQWSAVQAFKLKLSICFDCLTASTGWRGVSFIPNLTSW
jgi:hypothetical protein